MAVVLVESTAYRSIAHGVQQLAAIEVGTVVATGAALMLDSTMGAMVLVLPAAVLLGSGRVWEAGAFTPPRVRCLS
ncbi:hypothetical protein ACFY5C_40500 [Streptomyces sp. NPDC012935]|uniref:hypothetical protein n=1 Tax=Streptomyces sp. NPDC012935 TaxID=3364857 RepID=UPI0036890B0E